jgi:hypothetical protein
VTAIHQHSAGKGNLAKQIVDERLASDSAQFGSGVRVVIAVSAPRGAERNVEVDAERSICIPHDRQRPVFGRNFSARE